MAFWSGVLGTLFFVLALKETMERKEKENGKY
jgi:hypothetical protein